MVQFSFVAGDYEVDLGSPSAFPAYSVSGTVTLDLERGTPMRLRAGGSSIWLQAEDFEDEPYELQVGTAVVMVTGAVMAWDTFRCEWLEHEESRGQAEQEMALRAAYASVMARLEVA